MAAMSRNAEFTTSRQSIDGRLVFSDQARQGDVHERLSEMPAEDGQRVCEDQVVRVEEVYQKVASIGSMRPPNARERTDCPTVSRRSGRRSRGGHAARRGYGRRHSR